MAPPADAVTISTDACRLRGGSQYEAWLIEDDGERGSPQSISLIGNNEDYCFTDGEGEICSADIASWKLP
jgi:hypothetical protein